MDYETAQEKSGDEEDFYSRIGRPDREDFEYDLTDVVSHHFKEDVPVNIDPYLYDYSPRKSREKWF